MEKESERGREREGRRDGGRERGREGGREREGGRGGERGERGGERHTGRNGVTPRIHAHARPRTQKNPSVPSQEKRSVYCARKKISETHAQPQDKRSVAYIAQGRRISQTHAPPQVKRRGASIAHGRRNTRTRSALNANTAPWPGALRSCPSPAGPSV